MHRTKNELENVIKKIKSDTDLNVIIDKKKIALKDIEGFLNDTVTRKINNKYDAKQEYLKKIQDDEDLLKLVSAIFIKFIFFHQMIALQKL